MNVYMLKDVENVGMSGEVIKVADGYAQNFLIPRKLAMKVLAKQQQFFSGKVKIVDHDKSIIKNKVAMLAEHIRNLHLVIKERTHNDGKLYGAVGQDEVVELLKSKDIVINRKQVEFKKAIRATGDHSVIIRLSAKLKPELTLKVVSNGQQENSGE